MRCEDERVLCLLIYSKRDLTNPKVDDSIKEMIKTSICRCLVEEKALEFTSSDEETAKRKYFGCCDLCSEDLESWPGEDKDRRAFSVGNKHLFFYLMNYFDEENKHCSPLNTGLTDKLAKTSSVI